MNPSHGKRIMTVVYVLMAAVMYYFNNESVQLGVGIMYKLFLSAVLAFFSICVFLVTTNLTRAGTLVKYIMLFCLPEFAAIFVSVPIWLMKGFPMEIVRRGFMEELYNIGIVLAMAGFVYVFGSKAIWRVFTAMCLANFFRIVRIIVDNGLSAYFEELKTLIVSFAEETGELIRGAEIHELTFALGMFLVFFSLHFRNIQGKKKYLVLAVTIALFFYLSGFKRIGVTANAVAAAVGFFLISVTRKKEKGRGWLLTVSFAVVVICYCYIVLIHGGLADYLSSRYGINMMGRTRFYSIVEEYYRIDPGYFGQGVGFISRFFSSIRISALHNDILRIYIDLGFWGFFIWMTVFVPVRVWFVAKWQGMRGGILCLAYVLYLIVTASTDNTFYYVYVTGTAAVLVMSYRLEELEKKTADVQREAVYGER